VRYAVYARAEIRETIIKSVVGRSIYKQSCSASKVLICGYKIAAILKIFKNMSSFGGEYADMSNAKQRRYFITCVVAENQRIFTDCNSS